MQTGFAYYNNYTCTQPNLLMIYPFHIWNFQRKTTFQLCQTAKSWCYARKAQLSAQKRIKTLCTLIVTDVCWRNTMYKVRHALLIFCKRVRKWLFSLKVFSAVWIDCTQSFFFLLEVLRSFAWLVRCVEMFMFGVAPRIEIMFTTFTTLLMI